MTKCQDVECIYGELCYRYTKKEKGDRYFKESPRSENRCIKFLPNHTDYKGMAKKIREVEQNG